MLVLLAAALTALGYLTRSLWRGVRVAVHAAETIQREFNPNGGGSTYDIVRGHSSELERQTQALSDLKAEVDAVRSAADTATTKAVQAVNEAKLSRAVIAEAAERNRAQIGEVRQVVTGLAGAMESDAHERKAKEVAYVRALNAVGVPLQPITAALDEVIDTEEPA